MKFEIYCDESRQELFHSKPPGEHYVLIGGIWIKKESRESYKTKIRELRTKHNTWGEIKWNHVDSSRLKFYLDLIQFFFSESADNMRFRVIVLRADEMDAAQFSQNDKELMFYKFYYQLLHHWILDFNEYDIFLDAKTNRVQNRLNTLRRCLRSSNLTSELTVQALPSKQVDLIQLADVLIGAVGYKFHNLSSSPNKIAVVEKIEEHIKRAIGPTSKAEEKFNVFRFRPGGGW